MTINNFTPLISHTSPSPASSSPGPHPILSANSAWHHPQINSLFFNTIGNLSSSISKECKETASDHTWDMIREEVFLCRWPLWLCRKGILCSRPDGTHLWNQAWIHKPASFWWLQRKARWCREPRSDSFASGAKPESKQHGCIWYWPRSWQPLLKEHLLLLDQVGVPQAQSNQDCGISLGWLESHPILASNLPGRWRLQSCQHHVLVQQLQDQQDTSETSA